MIFARPSLVALPLAAIGDAMGDAGVSDYGTASSSSALSGGQRSDDAFLRARPLPFMRRLDTAQEAKGGCTCDGECSQGPLPLWWEGCAAQATCEVDPDRDDNCGSGQFDSSFLGREYAFCNEKISSDEEKKDIDDRWDDLQGDRLSQTYFGRGEAARGMLRQSAFFTTEAHVDELSKSYNSERKKYLNAVGVVGRARFEPAENTPYTGIFNQNSSEVLIRLSVRHRPSSSFEPGLALKFFRGSNSSANLLAMGEETTCSDGKANFFEQELSSIDRTSEPSIFRLNERLVFSKFWQVSNCQKILGHSDAAGCGPSPPEGPAFCAGVPFELVYKLAPDIGQVNFRCEADDSAWTDLMNVEVEKPFIEIFARDIDNPGLTSVGTVFLTNQLITSNRGDTSLFFRHEVIENTLQYREDWLETLRNDERCGSAREQLTSIPPIPSDGCARIGVSRVRNYGIVVFIAILVVVGCLVKRHYDRIRKKKDKLKKQREKEQQELGETREERMGKTGSNVSRTRSDGERDRKGYDRSAGAGERGHRRSNASSGYGSDDHSQKGAGAPYRGRGPPVRGKGRSKGGPPVRGNRLKSGEHREEPEGPRSSSTRTASSGGYDAPPKREPEHRDPGERDADRSREEPGGGGGGGGGHVGSSASHRRPAGRPPTRVRARSPRPDGGGEDRNKGGGGSSFHTDHTDKARRGYPGDPLSSHSSSNEGSSRLSFPKPPKLHHPHAARDSPH